MTFSFYLDHELKEKRDPFFFRSIVSSATGCALQRGSSAYRRRFHKFYNTDLHCYRCCSSGNNLCRRRSESGTSRRRGCTF